MKLVYSVLYKVVCMHCRISMQYSFSINCRMGGGGVGGGGGGGGGGRILFAPRPDSSPVHSR